MSASARSSVIFNGRGATLSSVVASIEACAGKRLCILVDQFEELFRFERETSREEAELFVSLLIDQIAVDGSNPKDSMMTRLPPPAFTSQSRCARNSWGNARGSAGSRKPSTARNISFPGYDMRTWFGAIRRPAELYDGEVSIELAERLIADVRGREDELPLIQHGLMLLWNRAVAATPGRPVKLGIKQFERAGGLTKLLSDHANRVMREAKLSKPSEDAAERLFRALTDINAEGRAIRRPLSFEHLVAVCDVAVDDLRAIINIFRADGVSFLTPYLPAAIENKTIVDISHEALIRCWNRISDPQNGWLRREFQDGLVWRSLLIDAKAFEQDSKFILAPAVTEQRAKWLSRWNSPWSERYGGGWDLVGTLLQASRRSAARSKTIRRLALTPFIFLVGWALLGILAAVLNLSGNAFYLALATLAILASGAILIFATQLVVDYSVQLIRSERVRLLLVPAAFLVALLGFSASYLIPIPEPTLVMIQLFFVLTGYSFCAWAFLRVRRLVLKYVVPRISTLMAVWKMAAGVRPVAASDRPETANRTTCAVADRIRQH